jgi:hypothetical protein
VSLVVVGGFIGEIPVFERGENERRDNVLDETAGCREPSSLLSLQ